MEDVVGASSDAISEIAGECYAFHPADSTSACSSTVRVAFACLSGG